MKFLDVSLPYCELVLIKYLNENNSVSNLLIFFIVMRAEIVILLILA